MCSRLFEISADLLEEMNEWPVEEVPDEELVTTSNGGSDVSQRHCGSVVLRVRELATGSYHYTNNIKNECSGV